MIVISNAFVYSTCLLVVVFRYGSPLTPGSEYRQPKILWEVELSYIGLVFFFQNVINRFKRCKYNLSYGANFPII
ncbi:hypothetical protein DFH28DRAFT_1015054 [Melampsora americana]|nr:hypothetical protein DFH28DRAFT_1015054 [Melampsora americana]